MTDMAARLRQAREAAGFATVRDAVNRYGLNYATYAGHENGNRGMKPDVLRDYARKFRVDLAWLISGTGTPPGPTAERNASPPGFAEMDVRPILAVASSAPNLIGMLASSLAPKATHVVPYCAQRAFPAFSILPGDVLLIGQPPKPQDGDLVVATLSDDATNSAFTVLRQRIGDRLVPPLYGAIENEDKMTAGILGTVLAVIRAPALQP